MSSSSDASCGLNVWQRAGAALAVVILAAAAPSLFAAGDVLKVCQDPGNLPFSNEKGEGFENRIAELLAQKLGWKLEYFSFPQRMGFIRNTLRFKLPGEGLSLRPGDRRAREVGPGRTDQALLSFNVRVGLSAGRQARRRAHRARAVRARSEQAA
jgi:hypothetical protein